MPIYEYRCKKCGERFEMFRSIKASDSDLRCLKCGSDDLERLLSTFVSTSGTGSAGDIGCVPTISGG